MTAAPRPPGECDPGGAADSESGLEPRIYVTSAAPSQPLVRLGDLLADHFRLERAVAAARRFIGQRIRKGQVAKRSDVVAFLGRRRERLHEEQLGGAADEAMRGYRAGRYRGPA